MDWAKAKTVLILVLIALNIFLFVNLNLYSSDNAVSKETISNTLKTLENSGITLKCTIPNRNNDPGKLTYADFKLDRRKIALKLIGNMDLPDNIPDNQAVVNAGKKLVFKDTNNFIYSNSEPHENVNITSKAEIEKFAKSFLDGLGLPVSAYSLDSYTVNPDNSITLDYIEKYMDYNIFDSYSKIQLDKNGVKSLECRYKKPSDIRDKSNKRIISAYQILLKEYTKLENLTITDVSIGFKDYSLEENTKEYYGKPVWRIRTAEQGERLFSVSEGKDVTDAGKEK